MKYVVRKVVSEDRKTEFGYGVFPRYHVDHMPETGTVVLARCTDPDDKRPMHEQHKSYRLNKLCDTHGEANTHANALSAHRHG